MADDILQDKPPDSWSGGSTGEAILSGWGDVIPTDARVYIETLQAPRKARRGRPKGTGQFRTNREFILWCLAIKKHLLRLGQPFTEENVGDYVEPDTDARQLRRWAKDVGGFRDWAELDDHLNRLIANEGAPPGLMS